MSHAGFGGLLGSMVERYWKLKTLLSTPLGNLSINTPQLLHHFLETCVQCGRTDTLFSCYQVVP